MAPILHSPPCRWATVSVQKPVYFSGALWRHRGLTLQTNCMVRALQATDTYLVLRRLRDLMEGTSQKSACFILQAAV